MFRVVVGKVPSAVPITLACGEALTAVPPLAFHVTFTLHRAKYVTLFDGAILFTVICVPPVGKFVVNHPTNVRPVHVGVGGTEPNAIPGALPQVAGKTVAPIPFGSHVIRGCTVSDIVAV